MPHPSRLIVGLGQTGLSVARYFSRKQLSFRVIDTRFSPPGLSVFKKLFPAVSLHLGSMNEEWINQATEIILSPGIDPKLLSTKQKNINDLPILSDIELFSQAAQAPIIAITGSNGKSTVTTLIYKILSQAQKAVEIGGNLGKPVLDLLEKPVPEFYVLELSSFQLAITKKLISYIAIFLNLSDDHMDRHKTLNNYKQAKQNIYQNCKIAIWNRGDQATYPQSKTDQIINFGTSFPPSSKDFGLVNFQDEMWLAQGTHRLLKTAQLKIKGGHNWLNALVTLAVSQTINLPLHSTVQALSRFKGLEHRFEWIEEFQGIEWINDSKATNIAATMAALSNITEEKRLILIAGGLGKGAHFEELKPFVKQYVKLAILIGQASDTLEKTLNSVTPVILAKTLKHAVQAASKEATSGDIVLLSPACASQDMFANYAERGKEFKKQVQLLISQRI